MAKSTINVRILGDNKDLNRALDESEGRLGKFAGVAGAAVVAGAAGAAVGLAKLGSDFDEQFDKIRVGTGATGDTLAGLQQSFEDVLSGTNRATFDTAGTAIADLNTRLGLTGDELEALSTQFINLSDITGTDLTDNVGKITRVFGDWGIEDQAGALDEIYRAAQASGIGLDDLSGSVVQFGAPLRNLGFGFEDSLALLAQFDKAGVNTETVFAGLKAGVGKLAKEGEDVPETFARIVDEITALGPGSEATALAIELFGQRAGPDLADAIAGGKFEIDEMLAAITDGTDTINAAADDTESFGEKWNGIKNRVFVGLQPLAEKVFDGVGRAMDKLGPYVDRAVAWLSTNLPIAVAAIQRAWEQYGRPTFDAIVAGVTVVVDWFEQNWPKIQASIESVVTWLQVEAWPVVQQIIEFIRGEFDKLVAWVEENWPRIQATIEGVVEAVRIIVENVVKVITELWERFGDDILALAENAWENIKNVIEQAINIVLGIINTVTSLIRGDWEGAWNGIKDTLEAVWELIKGIVDAALDQIVILIGAAWEEVDDLFADTWNGLKDFVGDTWDGITEFVSDGVDAVVGFIAGLPGQIASAVTGGFDAIWEEFKGVINRIIRGWNNLEFSLPGVSTPFGDVGGFTIGTPNISELATGGVITSPTLALVGEYAGARSNPEIVSPRSAMVDAVREAMGGGGPQIGLNVEGDLVVSSELDVETVSRRILFNMAA